MNTHYTPGPWEIAGARVGKDGAGIIAECFGRNHHNNIRLISKAPEMEELLRKITDYLTHEIREQLYFDCGWLRESMLLDEIDTLRQYIHEGTP
jgi:hypothetical protein